MSPDHRLLVGITIGDFNGIGPEIILKALGDNRLHQSFTPILFGSSRVLNHYKKLIGLEEVNFQGIKDASEAIPRKFNLISLTKDELVVEPGKVTEKAGWLAFQSLESAVKDLAANKIDVLVTAPINKKNIQQEGFKFPGHTEYLAAYSNVDEALMLMCCPVLKVGVVTGHIPLSEVAGRISESAILNKLRAMDKTLRQDFSIRKPKIAVLGLNPHAGDEGLIGTEDQKIIGPAIEQARSEGIFAIGPFPSDGFFGSTTWQQFDAVLAMYHDQGLIPFKHIAGDMGVNFTAGLPIVRTSPAHGTAYDIAGKGVADENSFRQAIYMAVDIFRARLDNRLLQANAMQPSKKEA